MGRAADIKIDFSECERIYQPKRLSCCAINVNTRGHISLNERLIEKLGEHVRAFFLWLYKEGEVIILKQGEGADYHFPKNGSKKDLEFSRRLTALGVSLPARYEVEWNQDADAWVGVLTNTGVPDVAALGKKYAQSGKERRKELRC